MPAPSRASLNCKLNIANCEFFSTRTSLFPLTPARPPINVSVIATSTGASLPISPVDCIRPAFEHTKQQLFAPFRMGQWWRLALVGLLAGELSSGGCPGSSLRDAARGGGSSSTGMPRIDPQKIAQFLGLIIVAAIAVFILYVLFLYLSSMFRFILYESVIRRNCQIGESWDRWHRAGRRYFLWQVVFIISTALLFTFLVGLPLGMAAALGWLSHPKSHLAVLILGGFFLAICLLTFAVVVGVTHVLSKDFLVPVMALEDLDFAEAWHRVFQIAAPEKGSYAIYILLKIGLAIAAGIIFGILNVIAFIIMAIPVAIVAVAVGLAGKSAGMAWNASTITLAIVFGSIALAVMLYVISLISTPASVFFPAYPIYFFADRYPALHAWLYPAPPVPVAPPVLEAPTPPASEPPPLPPTPELS